MSFKSLVTALFIESKYKSYYLLEYAMRGFFALGTEIVSTALQTMSARNSFLSRQSTLIELHADSRRS